MAYQEGKHDEYKKARKSIPEDMWETVSSFANTDGGHIHLGFTEIKDKKTQLVREYKPTGVLNPEKMKKDLLDTANNKNKLSAPVIKEDNIEIKSIGEVKVIEIYIPAVDFTDRPVYIKGDQKNVYKRVGTADQKATEEDIKAMLRDASPDDSGELLDGFSIKDLNLIDLQAYKTYLAERVKDPEIAEEDNKQFLEEHGFMNIDRKDGIFKLTKGALLLFGKYNAIRQIFPAFMLDLIIKHNPADENYVDRVYTSFGRRNHPENIYSFFVEADNKIKSLINNNFQLDGIARRDSGERFYGAIREALVNCLVHADYHSKRSVQIIWYDEYVVFENPGHMLVTKNEFFSPFRSAPRNEVIFQAFVIAKLGEHTGRGGYTILRAMEDLKTQLPELETDPRQTTLVLWKTTLEDILNSLPEEWRPVYKLLNKKIAITFKDVSPLFSKPWKGHAVLKEMMKKGLIRKEGSGRATQYVLPVNSPKGKRLMREYIRKIQEQTF